MDPPTSFPLVTPHRLLHEIQQWIWNYFAVKHGHFYLAGVLIGIFAGLIWPLHHPDERFRAWMIPAGAALGGGAVCLLSFWARFETRLTHLRAKGQSTWALRVLFVVLGGIGLVVVAVLVCAICLALL